jgi:ribosomal protein S18 acetylase RimI-like enzyme
VSSCALACAVIEHARARDGVLLLNLTVAEGNGAAVHLYRSIGFQAYGVEPMAIFTPSGFKAKVYMWLPLQPRATTT